MKTIADLFETTFFTLILAQLNQALLYLVFIFFKKLYFFFGDECGLMWKPCRFFTKYIFLKTYSELCSETIHLQQVVPLEFWKFDVISTVY